jgi:hypothetical protein
VVDRSGFLDASIAFLLMRVAIFPFRHVRIVPLLLAPPLTHPREWGAQTRREPRMPDSGHLPLHARDRDKNCPLSSGFNFYSPEARLTSHRSHISPNVAASGLAFLYLLSSLPARVNLFCPETLSCTAVLPSEKAVRGLGR